MFACTDAAIIFAVFDVQTHIHWILVNFSLSFPQVCPTQPHLLRAVQIPRRKLDPGRRRVRLRSHDPRADGARVPALVGIRALLPPAHRGVQSRGVPRAQVREEPQQTGQKGRLGTQKSLFVQTDIFRGRNNF